ncbi:hypothetical protein K505DRAFT_388103 [Melanomma pulvis-pyrius CBS 109.77]|uniref:Uncharacterized protein n=1 Tax=Melanomma pulvis-pyrius CBS 109.77 TaxID=1314802 RepID=A0A6A6XSL0_9PLEO|nr:hypothetical protein K505DRAFT_388103 [Melanomma pulvis-pyrius CBS 109.77]
MLIGRITREFLPGARRAKSETAERRAVERIRVERHSKRRMVRKSRKRWTGFQGPSGGGQPGRAYQGSTAMTRSGRDRNANNGLQTTDWDERIGAAVSNSEVSLTRVVGRRMKQSFTGHAGARQGILFINVSVLLGSGGWLGAAWVGQLVWVEIKELLSSSSAVAQEAAGGTPKRHGIHPSVAAAGRGHAETGASDAWRKLVTAPEQIRSQRAGIPCSHGPVALLSPSCRPHRTAVEL